MPRKKQTKRTDQRYEYKLTIGKDIRGVRIRKSFYSSISLADAKRQAEDYKISTEVAARTGEAFITSSYDFSTWSRKWLETYKKPFVDENTYKLTYESLLYKHILPFFGKSALTDIKPIDIQRFFSLKTHCSESRLKKMKLILNAIFEAGIENDICQKTPAKRCSIHSTAEKHIKTVLSDSQIEITKAAARMHMPEVLFLLETGLRRGELLGLMWSDYDAKEQTIQISRSMALKSKKVVANPPKWNSYRTLPLSCDAISMLQELPRKSMYIFPNAKGAPHSPDSWSKKLQRFMCELHKTRPEIPIVTAHELRHTYATMLRRHGVDIYSIQKLLGHKDIQVTAGIYVHNELDQLRAALFSDSNKAAVNDR